MFRNLCTLVLGFFALACSNGVSTPPASTAAEADSGTSAPPAPALDPAATERLYLSGRGIDDAVDWQFMLETGRGSGVWSTLPVPSHWEFHGFGDFQYGHNPSSEVGHYRRSFALPAAWAGRRVFIVLEGAMTDTEVSVNGTSAGPVHRGGFYRFGHEITGLTRPGEENQLDVIVSKQSSDASVNAAEREADYWTFGGIYRPVYLEAVPAAFIDRIAINALASGAMSVDVFLRDVAEVAELTAQVSEAGVALGAPFSAVVEAGANRATLSVTLPSVRPWSAESPNLYDVEVHLRTESGIEHAIGERFGFRTIEVRPGDGIYVNGSKVMLRGANRHSFWPDSGRALAERISRDDIQVMKDMNMNAARMSHYPPDEHFLDAADELGLYVLDELAGWQSPPYDEAAGAPLVKEMVTFDVNHPSILFWNNGNEGGWNGLLDDDFAEWDPQRRPVLHPWATFSGINTDHYENYTSHSNILSGNTLFMPTEFLHGLYDGGAGAGLEDYWNRMLESPVGVGGFLWALVDEGVRRSPGWVDVVGNAAPDGILGPYREKEGSFYTIRQLWSPVQIEAAALPADFGGALPVQNRYDFTDLSSVEFRWRLAGFDFAGKGEGRQSVVAEGTARTGSIAPRQSGTLSLPLPIERAGAHALLLDAFDATGRLIGKWSWMLAPASRVREGIVSETSAEAALGEDYAYGADAGVDRAADAAANTAPPGASLTVSAAGRQYIFDRASARLTGVVVDGAPFSLSDGPLLTAGTSTLTRMSAKPSGNDYVIDASFDGALRSIVWRVLGNGWLELSYRYALQGNFDFYGVSFNYPEARVSGAEWLGRGPHRVWKNRMKGAWHDVWSRRKNDAVTGQVWEYPEFKGYFADVYWMKLFTTEGTLEVVVDSPAVFMRLYTPRDGFMPQTAAARFPSGDISFLQGIAPIGDKFLAAAALGPQSQPNVLNGEIIEGRLYFRFSGSAP